MVIFFVVTNSLKIVIICFNSAIKESSKIWLQTIVFLYYLRLYQTIITQEQFLCSHLNFFHHQIYYLIYWNPLCRQLALLTTQQRQAFCLVEVWKSLCISNYKLFCFAAENFNNSKTIQMYFVYPQKSWAHFDLHNYFPLSRTLAYIEIWKKVVVCIIVFIILYYNIYDLFFFVKRNFATNVLSFSSLWKYAMDCLLMSKAKSCVQLLWPND